MPNSKRIPKGSPKGGQFAPDPKSATSDLSTSKKKTATQTPEVFPAEEQIKLNKLYEAAKNKTRYISLLSDEERETLLEEYEIEVDQLPIDIPQNQLDEALEMIGEARDNLRGNRYSPGSRDYDPGEVEGLISDAFELLGYEPSDAYSEGMKRLRGVDWEPSYNKYNF